MAIDDGQCVTIANYARHGRENEWMVMYNLINQIQCLVTIRTTSFRRTILLVIYSCSYITIVHNYLIQHQHQQRRGFKKESALEYFRIFKEVGYSKDMLEKESHQ